MLKDTLPWYVAGPAVGAAIVLLLGLANRRFGVTGGLTDLIAGDRGSWRVMLIVGIVIGSLLYVVVAGDPAPASYGWLDDRLSAPTLAGVLLVGGAAIGFGASWAGGCTSGHGLTGVALRSPASLAAICSIMGSAIIASLVLEAVL